MKALVLIINTVYRPGKIIVCPFCKMTDEVISSILPNIKKKNYLKRRIKVSSISSTFLIHTFLHFLC